jgi:penicillin-binding protein 2
LQLNKSEFAAFQEKYENLPVLLSKRSRDYEVDFGANVFGSITQVNERLIAKTLL